MTTTTITKNIILFGITAKLNVVDMGKEGILKEIWFTCDKITAEKIIVEAVKNGYPFERTTNGVGIFN